MDVQQFIRSLLLLLFILQVFFSVSLSRNPVPLHNGHHHTLRHMRHKRNQGPLSNNIAYGHAPNPNDSGPWGPWSESSECSRSCGGGVAFQTRRCKSERSDGSHSCVGPNKKFFSCNIQDCPENARDFRSEQCSQFDNVAFEGRYLRWVPYLNALNKCELNCMPHGERFYYRQAKKVIDGTRCEEDSLDVCVDGVCLSVGCDMMLGSKAEEDKCRECGGDGSTCKTVEGLFDLDNLQIGYNDILLIPAGATNILIRERKDTTNYLAVRNLTGHYYLNGNWRIDFPRELHFAGTTFHYRRKPHGFMAPESLQALGPTNEPIFVVLLYQESNPGISYEYSVPMGVNQPQPDSYSWVYGNFEECTRSCGGGYQIRSVSCARSSSFEVVPDYLCDPLLKPTNNKSCNLHSCPPRWHVGEWEECTASCGGGTQYRMVYCQQIQNGNAPSIINNHVCLKSTGPRPAHIQKCNEDIDCPEWHKGPWSRCDKICGDGSQTRIVTCQRYLRGKLQVFPESACDRSRKPENKKRCYGGPCEGVDWIVSDWSGCDTCGLLRESREVHCSNESGSLYPDSLCNSNRQPDFLRDCPDSPPCDTMWFTTEWSECSARCGTGIQTRLVFCATSESESIRKVPNEMCNPAKKYDEFRNCTSKPCKGVWFSGPWNRCSAVCAGGTRMRKILCLEEDAEEVLDHSNCDPSERPFEEESCNQHPCDPDEILITGGCKDSKHGCCPEGITPDDPNFEECSKMLLPDGCEATEFGCCGDGKTPAQGPFKQGCPTVTTCDQTKHGCCLDGVTPATGPNQEGCPEPETCAATKFGCCPDGVTSATGEKFEGCEFISGTDCKDSEHGCCPDGITPAEGPAFQGCEDEEVSGEACEESLFGCCPDNLTPAGGPQNEGCPDVTGIPIIPEMDCEQSTYGCCPDGLSAAQGENGEGCDISTSPPTVTPPPSDCFNTLYGCCPDGVTEAQGYNFEGCEDGVQVDCRTSVYGCCVDGVTAASGPEGYGCPQEDCRTSRFGCCSDGQTTALGPNQEGCTVDCWSSEHGCCPDRSTPAQGAGFYGCPCETMHFGCCPDKVNFARGPNFEGCSCESTPHGCCPDGYNIARGPNYEGCGCQVTAYGCCADGHTEAKGPNYEGCCDATTYGCCPDGRTEAQGPNFQGCSCETSTYGCCSDGRTVAQGPNFQGCSCESSTYGCCPDGASLARGPNYHGCPCHTLPYGCCSDGRTPARGPDQEGCGCEASHFGCCPDNQTPAQGPNQEGCGCEHSGYGCCPDNRTPARGPNQEGCERTVVSMKPGEVCGLPKERGSCRNFTVKWFFDMDYGGCSRFWYGGCEGNENRFDSQEECQQVCVTPEGMDACHLPKVVGPCDAHTLFWYFDVPSGQCGEFYYSGCLGNNNRFATREICENTCQKTTVEDPCAQPKVAGPCHGEFVRWYFEATDRTCKQFRYGGCKGNRNNFDTENACNEKCASDRDICSLSPDKGPCSSELPRWYFDNSKGQCLQFSYGGCEGNENRFSTEDQCESSCSSHRVTDTCSLPHDAGPCTTSPEDRWFFDKEQGRCRSFLYGGCEGNDNNFRSIADCESRCVPSEVDFNIVDCHLDKSYGTCEDNLPRWYYDKTDGVCKHFYYSGCNGNKNRFLTRQECEQRCFHSQDICSLPQVIGPCRGRFHQWFYNPQTDICEEFFFGGCEGNANRFDGQESCEQRCKKAPPKIPESIVDSCSLPQDPGPCDSTVPSWYYDRSVGKCLSFMYGGCEGNKNRFVSEEACERACGAYRGHDVCAISQDPGPCLGSFPKFYFDSAQNTCKSFNYGGCEGNGNRFSTRKECERLCLARLQIPANGTLTTPAAICQLPVDSGPCEEVHARWYFDSTRQTCVPFVYGGCGGNSNRFKTYEICLGFCSAPVCPDQEECEKLHCPYGIDEFKDEQGCLKCRCSNPCEGHYCPEGTSCAVEVIEAVYGETRGNPICRRDLKPGECPPVETDTRGSCSKDCDTDADCAGKRKCCFNGCGTWCIDPYEPEIPLATSLPDEEEQPVGEPPKLEPTEDEIRTRTGTTVELSCTATGHPVPQISWKKDGEPLIASDEHVTIFPDGTLRITNITADDAGAYHCIADNGIGLPAEKTVSVIIEEPASIRPGVRLVVVAVGTPCLLHCDAIGHPRPAVTWWRGYIMLPRVSESYQQYPNYSLLIRSVTAKDLGNYSCMAFNGIGDPATWEVSVLSKESVPSKNYINSVHIRKEVSNTLPANPQDVVRVNLKVSPTFPPGHSRYNPDENPHRSHYPDQQTDSREPQQPDRQANPNETVDPERQTDPRQQPYPDRQGDPRQPEYPETDRDSRQHYPDRQPDPNETHYPDRQTDPRQPEFTDPRHSYPDRQPDPNETRYPDRQTDPRQPSYPERPTDPRHTYPDRQPDPNETHYPDRQTDPGHPSYPERPTDPRHPSYPDRQTDPRHTYPDRQPDPNETHYPDRQTDPGHPSYPDRQTDPRQPSYPERPTDPRHTYPDRQPDPNETHYPDRQTDPRQPSYPERPTDPRQPSYPERPTDPRHPSYPERPTDPRQPSYPERPTDPRQPSYPERPTDPRHPSYPERPTDPRQPSYPERPTDPRQPLYPERPTDPRHPSYPDRQPDPNETHNPDRQTDPRRPSYPERPTDPRQSSYPDRHTDPRHQFSPDRQPDPNETHYPDRQTDPRQPSYPERPTDPRHTYPDRQPDPNETHYPDRQTDPRQPSYPERPTDPRQSSYPDRHTDPRHQFSPDRQPDPRQPSYPERPTDPRHTYPDRQSDPNETHYPDRQTDPRQPSYPERPTDPRQSSYPDRHTDPRHQFSPDSQPDRNETHYPDRQDSRHPGSHSPSPSSPRESDSRSEGIDSHRNLNPSLINPSQHAPPPINEDNMFTTAIPIVEEDFTTETDPTATVSARILLQNTNFAVNSNIQIDCSTDGSPRILWYKDGIELQPDPRTQILNNGTLIIYSAQPSDTATYRCEASNNYNVASSSVSVTVDGFQIHPNCTDNPYFANCKLIVKAKYCNNKYYARFCCKSCTLAGQLPVIGPHLPGYLE